MITTMTKCGGTLIFPFSKDKYKNIDDDWRKDIKQVGDLTSRPEAFFLWRWTSSSAKVIEMFQQRHLVMKHIQKQTCYGLKS